MTKEQVTVLDTLADIHDTLSSNSKEENGPMGVPYMTLSSVAYHNVMDAIEEALGKYVVGGISDG